MHTLLDYCPVKKKMKDQAKSSIGLSLASTTWSMRYKRGKGTKKKIIISSSSSSCFVSSSFFFYSTLMTRSHARFGIIEVCASVLCWPNRTCALLMTAIQRPNRLKDGSKNKFRHTHKVFHDVLINALLLGLLCLCRPP